MSKCRGMLYYKQTPQYDLKAGLALSALEALQAATHSSVGMEECANKLTPNAAPT